MNKTIKIFASLLLVIGFFLAAMAFFTSQREENAGLSKNFEDLVEEKKVQVAVAARDLPAGHLLTPEDIGLEKLAQMPQGGYATSSLLLGKTISQDIPKNQVLTKSSLLEGVAGMLAPGERAISIKVDEASAVGHKVQPGDWVDIFVVLRKDSQEVGDTQARMVLPRKRVLAYGAKIQGESMDTESSKEQKNTVARTAVVAVQVDEINRLILAEQHGQMQLALRSPFDHNEPSADILKQIVGINVRHALNQDVSKETFALDASLTSLKLSELGRDSALKPSAAAKNIKKTDQGTRKTSSVGNRGQVVEVIKGVNRETVRY